MIYWDHNATSPPRPEALAAMREGDTGVGNPSSPHNAGRAARRRIEACRDAMVDLVGAPREMRLVLTASGTEADNMAVLGLARAERARRGAKRVLIGAVEHPAVTSCAERLENLGMQVDWLAANEQGAVDVDRAEALLAEDVALVAVMLANNETGVIQPVAEVSRLAASHGAPLHCDAVQAVGKMPVDLTALGAATVAFSAHKLGGPRGIGGLFVRRDLDLEPLWWGGKQEDGMRPGTQATVLADGLAAAARGAKRDLRDVGGLATRRDAVTERLLAIRGAFVVGALAPRLGNTLAVGFEGVLGVELVDRLSDLGLMVSAGAACHARAPGEVRQGLLALGLSAERAAEVIRISIGWETDDEAIERGSELIRRAVIELRS